jgi:hypothetical protein
VKILTAKRSTEGIRGEIAEYPNKGLNVFLIRSWANRREQFLRPLCIAFFAGLPAAAYGRQALRDMDLSSIEVFELGANVFLIIASNPHLDSSWMAKFFHAFLILINHRLLQDLKRKLIRLDKFSLP